MTTEEFNAPNARGEEQSAVTVRECQGTICTITAKIFKKNFDLNVTSRTDLTYGDLDQYGNWRTRKETRTMDGDPFSRKATTRTFTYR